MAETPTGALVAGCPDIEAATKDFASTGARQEHAGLDRPRVPSSRRHCWRKPPSGLSRAGFIGEFVDHRVEQDIHDHADT